MNFSLAIPFALLLFSFTSWAKDPCVSPQQVGGPVESDLMIPGTPYSVGVCYLPEKIKNGLYDAYYRDRLVLKQRGEPLASQETKMHITVGRISDLHFEKATEKFIAVSYSAGEYCNGIVIFDTKNKKVVLAHGCQSYSDICHITELSDSNCKVTIECKDQGAEGEPPTRKEPIKKTRTLCKL